MFSLPFLYRLFCQCDSQSLSGASDSVFLEVFVIIVMNNFNCVFDRTGWHLLTCNLFLHLVQK